MNSENLYERHGELLPEQRNTWDLIAYLLAQGPQRFHPEIVAVVIIPLNEAFEWPSYPSEEPLAEEQLQDSRNDWHDSGMAPWPQQPRTSDQQELFYSHDPGNDWWLPYPRHGL